MKRHRFAVCFFAFMLGSTGIIVACSSSDSSSPSGSSGSSGSSGMMPSGVTTVHVSAAAGGTVADPAGKTTLTIPPGALEKDTDITLAIKPASAGAVADVSEFGPDGLKFLKPVTLAIKADASLAPSGKTLALATLQGAAFNAIDGSMYAGGAATGTIMHFSSYSVVVIDGTITLVPPASCAAALSGFAPCGGDPKGTWKFADFCVPADALGNPGGAKNCPELTATLDYTINADVVIDASSISIADGTATVNAVINYPLVCLTRDGDGGTFDSGINDCPSLQMQIYKDPAKPGTCTDKGMGICACTQGPQTQAQKGSKSTYTTSGTTITTTDATGKMSTDDYCVKSNLLQVRSAGKDGGAPTLYTLIRK